MSLIDTLKQLIAEGEELRPKGGQTFSGYNGQLQPEYVAWRLQAISAIDELGQAAKPILKDIENNQQSPYFFEASASQVLGALKGTLALAERQARGNSQRTVEVTSLTTEGKPPSKVFLVHGHNKALLEQCARFLEKLDLEPIILFEQPGRSQTIIEKLESNSDVRYAVILLTPDDVGKAAGSAAEPQPRARQNVILELGYLIAKLGRPHVAALFDESVELPSDYRGVEYIKVDAEGAWKLKLAREMRAADLPVDMNKAI